MSEGTVRVGLVGWVTRSRRTACSSRPAAVAAQHADIPRKALPFVMQSPYLFQLDLVQ
jgi:hypothetical protein